MDAPIDEALIKKEMLYPGSKYIPLTSGTRVLLHSNIYWLKILIVV